MAAKLGLKNVKSSMITASVFQIAEIVIIGLMRNLSGTWTGGPQGRQATLTVESGIG
ncbi:MAG: hypothetical protein NVSMB27_31350 [Ktedonobacteraceae bacterium]